MWQVLKLIVAYESLSVLDHVPTGYILNAFVGSEDVVMRVLVTVIVLVFIIGIGT